MTGANKCGSYFPNLGVFKLKHRILKEWPFQNIPLSYLKKIATYAYISIYNMSGNIFQTMDLLDLINIAYVCTNIC